MKKLLGIVVLSLLLSGNAYAGSVKVEFENCGELSSPGTFVDPNGIYLIKVQNKSTTVYRIDKAFFYTKDNQRMSVRKQSVLLGSFQEVELIIPQKKMIHSMLHKVILTCKKDLF
mgnify:CR=1 FL=1